MWNATAKQDTRLNLDAAIEFLDAGDATKAAECTLAAFTDARFQCADRTTLRALKAAYDASLVDEDAARDAIRAAKAAVVASAARHT